MEGEGIKRNYMAILIHVQYRRSTIEVQYYVIIQQNTRILRQHSQVALPVNGRIKFRNQTFSYLHFLRQLTAPENAEGPADKDKCK